MYRRYLPTLTLKKQQLQSEIRTIEAKAIAVRQERENLEKVIAKNLKNLLQNRVIWFIIYNCITIYIR